ncbi:conserved membrane protein of unknown function [Candidatus Promineifilum breve]|uniref:DUF4386 domain-containing protein n=1 Tax=Candidatus Promineifilum breve TaxID=1806508 RepID=A0A160T2P6_9CHLR|nr:DUF4386 domain-containing protein [Candidatus Promineifilum breve]CUS03529.2 conserved membrane protein of unknown function [Candidatus Promineifilum breve]
MKATIYSDNRNRDVPQTTRTRSRKIALAAGVLYLITFLSLPAFAFYAPVRDPNYLVGPGPDNAVIVGGILEIIVALACIGTAVALYPVIKRQGEGMALGFVGARILEAGTIFAGVVAFMTMVTLRQSGVGAEALITGRALLAMYDWFHLGQDLIPGVNAVLLGSLLYKSRLVPRILPLLGLIGAPLLVANVIVIMFGISGPLRTVTTLSVLPIAVWEFSLGVWLVVKGFNSTAITAEFDNMEPSR